VRRVRFAPSPTGPLHIGGLRTALFNYFFTKKSGGSFILRVEDTDKKREVKGADKHIRESLEWCGIEPDESPWKKGPYGPYRQSERNEIYKSEILKLIKSGHAYYAFDSEDELSSLRKEHEKNGQTFVYNWRNRMKLKNSLSLGKKAVSELLQKRTRCVVRFLSPNKGAVQTIDIIRGRSSIDCRVLDDKVLMKADGTPTYHFANVVDDHLMKITHVIRGEEWLPSLALHFLLYDAFGWQKPEFAHLPLILNPNGKGKLSKRSGEKGGFPVIPIKWGGPDGLKGFKENGFIPSGLINYLSTLGWTPKEGLEVLSLDELTKMFQLESVVSAGANFNLEKMKWYNHKHIQRHEDAVLAEEVKLLCKDAREIRMDDLKNAVSLVKERANTTTDLWGLMSYLFFSPREYDEKDLKKIKKEGLNRICSKIISLAEERTEASGFMELLKQWGDESGLGAGQIMTTTRVVLVGKLSGVDLQNIVSFIGLKNVQRRGRCFIKKNI
tara:strand:+ start:401 stop:1891 length:1491 start_codon:yes stop_codon:yes gene_type:complete